MPAGDFFGRGVAPMQNPFTQYMNPKTMTQQRAASPNWGNVGHGFGGDPFGNNAGDISGKGWQNPLDVFALQAEKEMAKLAQPQVPMGGAPVGGLNPSGGNNQYDQAFVDAAKEMSARYGVALDPAVLKSMAHIESGGTFGMPVRPADDYDAVPAIGMMQVKAGYWQHLVPDANPYDPVGNIRLGAAIMADAMAKNGGSWERAIMEVYHPGSDSMSGFSPSKYVNDVNALMKQYGAPGGGLAPGGGAGNASSVIQTATSFVGKMPYGWGGIPGKGVDPLSYVGPEGPGWDCSGFTYWLDQNFGSGDLPMGSHYQYQFAQQTGRLKTSANQLQPGDLVFFNTGAFGGGGSHLNNATHVGMYIGNDQFVHAANRNDGTIISSFSQYVQNYGPQNFLGGMSMAWSGGGAYSAPMQGGTGTYGYGSGSLFGNWSSMMDPNAAWRGYRR